jgi:hypothetical protein
MEAVKKDGKWCVKLDSEEEIYQLEDENFGMCLQCGEDHYNCEPDAAGYHCDSCDSNKVFGLMHLAFAGRLL